MSNFVTTLPHLFLYSLFVSMLILFIGLSVLCFMDLSNGVVEVGIIVNSKISTRTQKLGLKEKFTSISRFVVATFILSILSIILFCFYLNGLTSYITFNNLGYSFNSGKKLNPENQFSSDINKMKLTDYSGKINELNKKKSELIRNLAVKEVSDILGMQPERIMNKMPMASIQQEPSEIQLLEKAKKDVSSYLVSQIKPEYDQRNKKDRHNKNRRDDDNRNDNRNDRRSNSYNKRGGRWEKRGGGGQPIQF